MWIIDSYITFKHLLFKSLLEIKLFSIWEPWCTFTRDNIFLEMNGSFFNYLSSNVVAHFYLSLSWLRDMDCSFSIKLQPIIRCHTVGFGYRCNEVLVHGILLLISYTDIDKSDAHTCHKQNNVSFLLLFWFLRLGSFFLDFFQSSFACGDVRYTLYMEFENVSLAQEIIFLPLFF